MTALGLRGDGSAHSHEGHGPALEGPVLVHAHTPNIEGGPGDVEKHALVDLSWSCLQQRYPKGQT
jgi:hypothetical protein